MKDLTSEWIEYSDEELRYRGRYTGWWLTGFMATSATFWGFLWWVLT